VLKTNFITTETNCTLYKGLFTLIFFLNFSLFAQTPSLYVVISDDSLPLYKRIISGISIETLADFVEFSLESDASKAPDVMKQILALNPKVIIAIGPKSANAAKKHSDKIPIIYCLVPKPENYDLVQNNVVGIGLEFSLDKQFKALHTILPYLKKIGVLFNPLQSKITLSHAKKAVQNSNMSLVPIEILKPSDAKKALDDLQDPLDALWMISDPTALNIKAWNASQQYCLNKKIPFFALDDGFVARGALLSFSIDYVWIGRQAAKLANRILRENYSIKELNIIEPEGLDLSVNMTTATQLGIASELSLNLLNYAAVHKHAIQAFQ